jgi:alkylation response protein AidB-like acyl-CoA dehydrogenase
MADLGFIGIAVPEEYGGVGYGEIECCIIMEELAKACCAVAIALPITVLAGARVINVLGTEEQKQEYLPRISSGDLKWALGVTEPAGGTDILGALSTSAVPEGDEYVINGQKIFISGAHVADYIITLVITDPGAEKKARGLSVLIVDTKSPGLTINMIPKLGNHACGTCEIVYEDVRVPKKNLLGTLNRGWYDLLSILNPERYIVAAMSIGVSMAVLEDAIAYSQERTAFGKPLGEFMAVQHMIAEMAVDIELARNLLYKCAWLCEQGKPYHIEAMMLKYFASDRAPIHALNGMEILGGYGYCMEYDMQRYLRDSKQMPFSPINNESCKNMIAESFGLPKSY